MLSTFAMGIAFGIVEVAMPAFGEAHGSRAQGGFALSCFALGSLLGGIWIGTRPPPRGLAVRFILALAALDGAAPAAAGRSVDRRHVRADADRRPADRPHVRLVLRARGRAREPGTTTEAFALLGTAIVAGLSLGTSVSGVAIEQFGLTGALALAAPSVGAATLVAIVRRSTLAIPDAIP